MATALGFLLPGAFGTGGALALTTATGLTAAGIAVNIGASLLLSAATRPQLPDAAKPESVRQTSKVEAAPRIKHYGIVRVGGNLVFHRSNRGVSYRVMVHGHGEISRTLKIYLDGQEEAFEPDGFIVADRGRYVVKNNSSGGGSTFRPLIRIDERVGAVPSPVYPSQVVDWPFWTENHRLDGLWTSLIFTFTPSSKKFAGAFPTGREPLVERLAETTKCFDPRTGQTVFTANAALIIADFIRSPDGLNQPNAITDDVISAQADICDTSEAFAGGGAEPKYRIGGSYLLNERPQDVLGRMLAACAGRVRLSPAGKVNLKVGAWAPPEFEIGYPDILEVQNVDAGPDLLDRYNVLPGRFTSEDLEYTEADVLAWEDPVRVADDGDVLVGPDLPLQMCPSHRQARQVMKITMERDNPKQNVTLLCKPKALPAMYEDVVRLNVPQMGLVGDFEVVSHNLSFQRGLLAAVRLQLRKVDPAAFDLSFAEQGANPPPVIVEVEEDIPAPTNVTAAPSGLRIAGNVFSAGIGVAWDVPDEDFLVPVVRFTEAGTENFREVVVPETANTVVIPNLVDGALYDVSVAFLATGGTESEEVFVLNATASAVSDPPLPPTFLTVSDLGDSTALVEMTASTSPGLWKTEIYRDGLLAAVLYAGPASEIAFIDETGAGTFDWTARSVNVSDINSAADAGPVSATIA